MHQTYIGKLALVATLLSVALAAPAPSPLPAALPQQYSGQAWNSWPVIVNGEWYDTHAYVSSPSAVLTAQEANPSPGPPRPGTDQGAAPDAGQQPPAAAGQQQQQPPTAGQQSPPPLAQSPPPAAQQPPPPATGQQPPPAGGQQAAPGYGTIQGSTSPGATPNQQQTSSQAGVGPDPACYSGKQALVAAGATLDDLAIAFLETSNTNPPLGNNYPNGKYDGKQGDSANLTPFKINWYMVRTACTGFKDKNYTANDLSKGDVLSQDTPTSFQQAVQCLHETKSWPAFAGDKWYAVQRGGVGSLNQYPTDDPQVDWHSYKQAVTLIRQGLDGHLNDNVGSHYPEVAI